MPSWFSLSPPPSLTFEWAHCVIPSSVPVSDHHCSPLICKYFERASVVMRVLKEDCMLCFGTEMWHVIGAISFWFCSRKSKKERRNSRKRSRHFKSIVTGRNIRTNWNRMLAGAQVSGGAFVFVRHCIFLDSWMSFLQLSFLLHSVSPSPTSGLLVWAVWRMVLLLILDTSEC